MKRDKRGRTKKEFEPYNDYKDRPFGLKWRTAFAMDELTNTINASKNDFIDYNEKLPQMSREEIDEVLQYAFLKSKTISIQENKYNELGFIADSIVGKFQGYADRRYLYIDDKPIEWELVRNIEVNCIQNVSKNKIKSE